MTRIATSPAFAPLARPAMAKKRLAAAAPAIDSYNGPKKAPTLANAPAPQGDGLDGLRSFQAWLLRIMQKEYSILCCGCCCKAPQE